MKISQLLIVCFVVCELEGFEISKVPSILSRLKRGLERLEEKVQTPYPRLIKKISSAVTVIENEVDFTGCSCHQDTCGCCVQVHLFHLNDTVCFEIKYLSDGFMIELLLDGHVLLKETLSLSNPPPFCVGIPYVKKLASVCLRLYDLNYASHSLSGCAKIEIRLAGFDIESLDLGCFHFPIGQDGLVEGQAPVELTREEFLMIRQKGFQSEETQKALGSGWTQKALNSEGTHLLFNREYVKKASTTLIRKLGTVVMVV